MLKFSGKTMVSETVLLNLVAKIYESAIDDKHWPSFLEGFSDAVGGGPTYLVVHDLVELAPTMSIAARSDPYTEQLYLRHYGKVDAFRTAWLTHFSTADETGVITSEQLMPPNELHRTEFFNDFLLPHGIPHQFGGPIVVNPTSASVITCLRSGCKGPFGDEAVNALRLLLPHLQRALQLRSRTIGLQKDCAMAWHSLDISDEPLFIVDSQVHVLRANRAAEKLLQQNDGFCVRGGCLQAALSAETAQLRRLVAFSRAVKSNPVAPPGGAMRISRPSARRPFALTVVPLPQGPEIAALGTGVGTAAILVADPDRDISATPESLQLTFGLTRAESLLARELLRETSLEDAAKVLQIRVSTARTQLKSIFQKTNTRKQGELVRVLLLGTVRTQHPD